MKNTLNLGQLFRMRIRLHYTWFMAIILITAAVVTQFTEAYPLWQRIILGVGASLLYFMAITLRELILSLIAANKGIPARTITLFISGGVPQLPKEASSPAIELLLAIAGLSTNLLIAGLFYVVYLILVYTDSILVDVLVQWLAFIYLNLALLHFIPAFPLDGGRILRALLWKTTGNYERVTRITCWIGWGAGLSLTIIGIVITITTQQWFVGILLAFPGLVLQNAATHSRRQVGQHDPPAGQR